MWINIAHSGKKNLQCAEIADNRTSAIKVFNNFVFCRYTQTKQWLK